MNNAPLFPHGDHQVIRVFVSSTFRDMHAERDAINRLVFPELRRRCLMRGAEFIGVDMRWGVTEDEIRREGTLAICLHEIERSRPFFVCLLAERFGSVYPPEEVAPALVEAAVTSGCTPRQRLFKVELPLALPQILLGINQCIMLALSMLVITALVGTRDLGQEVYIALTKADPGRGLVAGAGVACLAIVGWIFRTGYRLKA